MQGAADGMLREALDCYDDGTIEDGDLSVIGLALEQFHHAVADRRAVLGMPASAADAANARAAKRPDFDLSVQRAEPGAKPLRRARPDNETLMKQFPNATKPFWRFRANVLKRFTCTRLPNDAPKMVRQGVEQGTTDV